MSTAESQSALWTKGAADWAKVQEGMVSPLYQTVLARLQPKAGDHLLDIGCGAGLFCQVAAAQGLLASGPGAAAKAEVGAAKARKVLAAAAEPYKIASGGYEFRNRFRYLLARPLRRRASRE